MSGAMVLIHSTDTCLASNAEEPLSRTQAIYRLGSCLSEVSPCLQGASRILAKAYAGADSNGLQLHKHR